MALLKAKTAYGTVVGQPTNFQASTIFKGIPFAKPPVGELRWEPPQPPDPWEDEYQAFQYGNIPIQKRPDIGTFYRKEFYPIAWPSSEDCLYLNVITPADSPDEKLPVALWVYGGGFIQGYSQKIETDGEALANEGIIYVSFNYRVGPFGYMSSPSFDKAFDVAQNGNVGLLDQIAAIKWVRKNIAAFGGDPDRITVFGQSAGAMSVYNLLCSPDVKGDIAGAIMESGGGPVTSMLDLPTTRTYCEEFIQGLNLDDVTNMRKIPADKFFDSWLSFCDAKGGVPFLTPYCGSPHLPVAPDQALRTDAYADVPCIIGSMRDEDSLIVNPDNPTYQMRDGFLAGVHGFCEHQAQAGSAPVYAYHFTNTSPGEPNCGAFHSSEHAYIFKTLNRIWRPYTGLDYEFANTMCKYWTNFIKTGNPNGEGLEHWSAYATGNRRAMKLDNRGCEMIPFPVYGNSKLLAEQALGGPIES